MSDTPGPDPIYGALIRGTLRYVLAERSDTPDSTPPEQENLERERYRLMRLCPCPDCDTAGRTPTMSGWKRCKSCRGEGRQLQEVATVDSPEAVGVALVTLAREDEWQDCPFGLIDRLGETGKKWLILPFQPSPRNVSDAGRTLARSKTTTPTQ